MSKQSGWPRRFPAVSVVISTYDRPALLDRALESVFDQTYADFDVWVVDDHTDDMDAMTEVMTKWYGEFKKRGIEFWAARLPTNSGYQCVPKNNGILHSSGDFIAYLDDDNVWTPDHLEVLMEAILRLDVDMVYGGRRYVNDTDDTNLPDGAVPAEPWDPARLANENYIDTSDMLHSRGGVYMMSLKDGFFWDEELLRFADWNFVHRWAQTGLTAAPVDKILAEYYWHGANLQLTRPPMAQPVTLPLSRFREVAKGQ